MLRFVFSVATGICAFGLGTWLGGRFFVPAGSGLAGPPIALSYGLLAAGAACLGAMLLAGRLPARQLRLAALLTGTLALALMAVVAGRLLAQAEQAPVSGNARFHTSPECWREPRMFHPGPPPADIANRMRLTETPASAKIPGEATVSPNDGYRFWVRNPDTTKPSPWSAALVVDVERQRRPTLVFEDVAQPIQPRWLTEKLIFVRVAWGRIMFSDLIFDVERKELIYNEIAEDGRTAFEQYKQACGGRCPCDSAAEGAAGALPPSQPSTDAIRGLLQLPTIFGPGETGGVVQATEAAPVAVYAEPQAEAEVIGRAAKPEDIDYREIGYEAGAAAVYDVRPGWYAVGLADRRRGWIKAEDSGPYTSVAALLPSRLTYLNERWNGELWSAPDGQASMHFSQLKKTEGRQEYSAVIRETRETSRGLWLNVALHDRDPCEGGVPEIADEGWVPAYDRHGQLVVWYYSRGC